MDKSTKLADHCEGCDQNDRNREAKLMHVKFFLFQLKTLGR